jgi:hypothetical protein
MDYFAYPENINVRSDVCRGSMAVEYDALPVQIHAVARDYDGKIHARTACDRLLVRFHPEEVEHVPWENIRPAQRCLRCGQATGFLAVNDDTGEVIPGRR